jgi:PAS domain S-box-containing protein
MNFITAKTKIVIGLIGILISILFVALALGLVPDNREAIMQGRAQLCESVAISSSAFVSRRDVLAVDALLRAVVRRNPELLAAAFRRENGEVIARAGDYTIDTSGALSQFSTDTRVRVPVRETDKPYGTIDFVFRNNTKVGALGGHVSQRILMVIFVAGASFLAFMLYMRKMLQHLDPSKSVPKRVRSALDNLVSGLFVLDLDDRIVLANEAFAHRVGLTTEELVAREASKLPWITPDTAATAEFPWTHVIKTNTVQSNVMMRLRCGDGVTRSFLVNCSPVIGQSGSTRGVLVSLEDITQLEQKEAELRESRDEANKANSAKSEFLARMSHEIRTPLNAILGFADILRRGFVQHEHERVEYLATIHASGQHLLAIINDILDLSKVEAGRLELERIKCSPHQLIRQVMNELSVRSKEKGIGLEYAAPDGLPLTITTDPVRFRQLLINLVGNAIKFTGKGGVKVVARPLVVDGVTKLSIDVIDSGIGMSKESLGKIFQPFVQADTSTTRRFGGTGLGLSICKRLAEALGGQITVKSELGRGSVFTVMIDPGDVKGVPIVRLEDVPDLGAEATGAGDGELRFDPTQPAVRILVADDGESNRKLIRLVLERAGLVVHTAENGAEAVKLATSETFDIILMDMNMPVMDGFTATRTLRDQGCAVPILALTADAMKGSEEKCRAAGCSGFVTKPIDMDRVIRVIASTLNRKLTSAAKGTPPPVTRAQQPPVAVPTPAARPAERITTTLPADDPVMLEIVGEFVDRLQQQVGAMAHAMEEKDLSKLAFLAHWLKGSGGTAGFDVFTGPARELERLARAGEVARITDALAEIKQLVERVERPVVPSSPPAAPIPMQK